jgi:hypothetical protein
MRQLPFGSENLLRLVLCSSSADVGNTVARAGYELALRESALHLGKEAHDAGTPALGQRRAPQ